MQKSVSINSKVKITVANGIVMALYVALSVLVAPVASGFIQFRISESLNHLVVFNRKLLLGVLGGVIFFNLFFGYGIIDALYGGTQTFIALGITALLQNKISNVKVRLLINTVLFTVSMFIIAMMLVPEGGKAFWVEYGVLAASEAIVMAISAPVMYWINKSVHFDKRL